MLPTDCNVGSSEGDKRSTQQPRMQRNFGDLASYLVYDTHFV